MILLGCVFFILGIIGILDNSNVIAIYASFAVGVFLCVLGFFLEEYQRAKG